MAFILRYFTESVYDVVVKQVLGLLRFQLSLLLVVYDHINTTCAIIQRLFGQYKRPPIKTVVAYEEATPLFPDEFLVAVGRLIVKYGGLDGRVHFNDGEFSSGLITRFDWRRC